MHRKLRALLVEHDMSLNDLARLLLLGRTATSQRLNYRVPWNLDEVYTICERLGIPTDRIPDYFPRRKTR